MISTIKYHSQRAPTLIIKVSKLYLEVGCQAVDQLLQPISLLFGQSNVFIIGQRLCQPRECGCTITYKCRTSIRVSSDSVDKSRVN